MYLVNGNKIWYPGIFPGHDNIDIRYLLYIFRIRRPTIANTENKKIKAMLTY